MAPKYLIIKMQFARNIARNTFKKCEVKRKTHLGCSQYYSQNQGAVEANGSLVSLPQTDVTRGAAKTPEQQD